MLDKTVKCPICGKPYKLMAFYAGDQSACHACVREAERAVARPTPQGDEFLERLKEAQRRGIMDLTDGLPAEEAIEEIRDAGS